MTKKPATVSVALLLLLLNALVWLAFAIIVASGAHPSMHVGDQVRWIMAILALLVAGVLLGLCIFIRRNNRIAYYLTLALLLVTSFLTITDQFGLSDLIVLAVMVIPLGLLIKDRAWYLQRDA